MEMNLKEQAQGSLLQFPGQVCPSQLCLSFWKTLSLLWDGPVPSRSWLYSPRGSKPHPLGHDGAHREEVTWGDLGQVYEVS